VKVKIGSDELWFAPAALHRVGGASSRRPTTGDMVVLAPGQGGSGCLRVGEVGTVLQDDHDAQPYKVRERPWRAAPPPAAARLTSPPSTPAVAR